jgi:hypothetical protein
MKVAIIGSGWFGCHIAKVLLKSNKRIHITIFEKNKDIFLGQSGFNSNRLHLGFHYPRANITRNQCVDNFVKFRSEYPNSCEKIKTNLIGIHKESKVKADKYKKIMTSSGLKFKKYNTFLKFKNITEIIKCDEMLINFHKSIIFYKKIFINKRIKIYFNNKIKKISDNRNYILLNNSNIKYDWVINCTACNFGHNFDVKFEPRITLIYKSILKNFAMIIMDGPFWSIYPFKNNLYTIGSVVYSRICKAVLKPWQAEKILKNFNNRKVQKQISLYEKQILNDFPKFKKYFKYHSYYKSIATVKNSKKDERPLVVKKSGRIISVLGGKIDTVIEAGEKVKKILKI